jgi:hypothetical protein
MVTVDQEKGVLVERSADFFSHIVTRAALRENP